jgi:hypothetical protein
MRLASAFVVLTAVAIQTPTASAAERWTVAFAQGTTEAIIRNGPGASVNIYCPSGQADPTPGMFVEVKKVSPKAGEKVAVRFVVDGKAYPFEIDEIQFLAKTDSQKSDLSALIEALTRSKGKSFAVEFPKLGISERFSLAGAKKAMTSAKELLDGCL